MGHTFLSSFSSHQAKWSTDYLSSLDRTKLLNPSLWVSGWPWIRVSSQAVPQVRSLVLSLEKGVWYCFSIQKVKSKRVSWTLLQETPGNFKYVYDCVSPGGDGSVFQKVPLIVTEEHTALCKIYVIKFQHLQRQQRFQPAFVPCEELLRWVLYHSTWNASASSSLIYVQLSVVSFPFCSCQTAVKLKDQTLC